MMDISCSGCNLKCAVIVQTQYSEALTVRKMDTSKLAELTIVRNEFSEPQLQLHIGNSVKRYALEKMVIHRRFIKEGKSSIQLPNEKVQLLISNCPPDRLLQFLRTLVAKSARHQISGARPSSRDRLFSGCNTGQITEISPLCDQDLACIRGPQPSSTTPTRKPNSTKRTLADGDKENIPPDRKLCRRNINLPNALSELTTEQAKVLQAVHSGKNVFFTGSAGSGKSYLLQKIIGSLPPEHTYATASTGIAAAQIAGMTLHAFAGIGSGNGNIERCVELASRPLIAAQWRRCRHLIVDEISMVDDELFTKLEAVAQIVRKSREPFGGIQLIISGDFFQLPPVCRSGEKEPKFCFETSAWRRCIESVYQLREVKRQTDASFIDILQQIRRGYCSPAVTKALCTTADKSLVFNSIEATQLCTHNEDVDAINNSRLNQLSGESMLFTSTDSDSSLSGRIDELCPAQRLITLKKGAQVMVVKNINIKEGLVNGSRGVLIGFDRQDHGFPIVRFLNGKDRVIRPERFLFRWSGGLLLSRNQLPLKLAWAVSIHKSQGMTLDLVEMSLTRAFTYGQAYVALSRARSLEGLKVIDFTPGCVRAHPKVIEYYKTLNTVC